MYGALPPEARSQQALLFNTARTGYNVLSASNAVGMGLNLNIRYGPLPPSIVFCAHPDASKHLHNTSSAFLLVSNLHACCLAKTRRLAKGEMQLCHSNFL